MPVYIPTQGQTGDLLMLPNTRGIRHSYAANMLDKVLLDNRFSQKLLGWLLIRGWLPHIRIKMQPGNLYLFWGYRSILANEACHPDNTRATAIYHFGNPHADSQFGAKLRMKLRGGRGAVPVRKAPE